MKLRLPLPLFALLVLTGCASIPFVRGAKQYAPDVVIEYRDYVNADSGIDVSAKAASLADADAFESAVMAVVVDHLAVKVAWERVRQPYADYVQEDTDLDAAEKNLRAANIARMDRLNAAESARWVYFGAGG